MRVESKSLCSGLYGHHSINVRCMVFVRLQSVEKANLPPCTDILGDKTLRGGKETSRWKGIRGSVDEVES